jgi:hypothetical protein
MRSEEPRSGLFLGQSAAPDVPCRDRPKRPPRLGHGRELFGGRTRGQIVDFANAFSQAQVIDRQNVGAVEHEHEEHFRRPLADAFYRDERLDHLLIRHPRKFSCGNAVGDEMLGKVDQVSGLLARQSASAEDFGVALVAGEKMSWCGLSARKLIAESAEKNRRHLRRYLLVENRFAKCRVIIAPRRERTRTDAADDAGEFGIDPAEVSGRGDPVRGGVGEFEPHAGGSCAGREIISKEPPDTRQS